MNIATSPPPPPPPIMGWNASPSQGHLAMRVVPRYSTCPGLRETMWIKVSCLRKQHEGRDQARITNIQTESSTR